MAFTALQNKVTVHYCEPQVSFPVEFVKQLILMTIIMQSIKHSLECDMGVLALDPSLLFDIEADDALDGCTLWTRGGVKYLSFLICHR